MAVLKLVKRIGKKKLKASSLVETLVATVIIVLIFGVTSLTLNNIFSNAIRNNTSEINTQLNYLQYQYLNNQIQLPYADTFKDWDITIQKTRTININYISFEATHLKYQKTVTKNNIDATE